MKGGLGWIKRVERAIAEHELARPVMVNFEIFVVVCVVFLVVVAMEVTKARLGKGHNLLQSVELLGNIARFLEVNLALTYTLPRFLVSVNLYMSAKDGRFSVDLYIVLH